MTPPPSRGARAVTAAAAAVALGVTGHVTAGGEPTVPGVVLSFLAVALPSWMLAGRERGWAVLAAVQIGAQQVLHPLLTTGAGEPVAAAIPHDVMFLAHLAGALAVACWLRSGERRAWALARRALARLTAWYTRLAARLPLPAVAPAAPAPRPRAPRPRRTPLRHALLRGPPSPA